MNAYADADPLVVRSVGAVDWVTLNRPDHLNALDEAMTFSLWEYFSGLERDHSRRIVVLKGAGRAFCAGKDLKEGMAPSPRARTRPEVSLVEIVRSMRRCPQPIIALVHGPACGGGFILALASDIRIAGASARMNDAFIKIGLSGCELGISYFLPRMVGLSLASELMFTGGFIDASRALASGLVSQVTEDDAMEAAANRLISDMLLTSPVGLRTTKSTLNLAMKLNDLDAVLEIEQQAQISCMRSGDSEEAIAAFLEKRLPRYVSDQT